MNEWLVSFDVGGTLVDVEGQSLATTMVAQSPLPRQEARAIVRQGLLTERTIAPPLLAEVSAALLLPNRALEAAHVRPRLRARAHAEAVLRALAQRYRLVTLSNVVASEAESRFLDDLLQPWVARQFRSCDIGIAKPDPEAFSTVSTATNTPMEMMIHVGDDWLCDVVGARRAGARAIWLAKNREIPDPTLVGSGLVSVCNDLQSVADEVARVTAEETSERV